MSLEEMYSINCVTPSDINEHLPVLKEYADKCNHVTEMGVRGCVSLTAFLVSNAVEVVAIDILDVWTPYCEKLQFICADTLEIEIDNTDFLFIDTFHTYEQLQKELELHANKVNKYIGFHDIFMFGKNGETGGKGLMQAIKEFLNNNPEWSMCYHTQRNNGLMIISK